MDERTREVAPLAAWLASLVVAIVAFTAMGGGQLAAPPLSDPGSWADWAGDRDGVVATVAVLRLVVLALAWYLVGVTTIGAVARLARLAQLVRVADALSVPVVRRVLQASLGVGLATSVVVTPTGAVLPRPAGPTMAVAAGQSVADAPVMRPLAPASSPSPSTTPLAEPELAPPGMRPLPADRTTPTPVTPQPVPTDDGQADADLVTVVEGDHLWAIAERHVRQVRGDATGDTEVADYWYRLIDVNRGRLVDPDDPDLVLPGQRFVLPDLDARAGS